MVLLKKTTKPDFSLIIQKHIDNMYRLAYRFTNCPHDAQDLVQDVLLKIYPRHEEWSQYKNLKAWLATVIYHSFVDRWRHRYYTSMQSLNDQAVSHQNNSLLDELPSHELNPAEQVEINQRHKRLLNALTLLTEEHRILIILHDVEGYTLPELQQITEIPLGTLKSRLHRARAKLRETMTEKTCHLIEVIS